jgi:hypothetical protein
MRDGREHHRASRADPVSATPGQRQVPLAVDRNGEIHDTHAIESAPASLAAPLRCADCGAMLEAVRAHPRRDGANIVHVAAHYRLAPGATHAFSCPWRTQQPGPAPAARPVARSRPALQVYSLVVPGRRTPSPVWHRRSFRAPRRPALNSAAQVADLLARHGQAPNQVSIDYRGRRVRWQDFLFTSADTARLAQYLCRTGSVHPVAVVGVPGEREAARSGDSHYWILAHPLAQNGTCPRAARVILRSSRGRLLLGDTLAQTVVALGWWQLRRPGVAADFDEIVLWVNRWWQIAACPDAFGGSLGATDAGIDAQLAHRSVRPVHWQAL